MSIYKTAYKTALRAICLSLAVCLASSAPSFADELENQSAIRVNAIDPGAVRTNMRVTSFPGIKPEEMTDPKDIMDTYMYLMCDASMEENGYTFWAQKSDTDPTTAV